MIPSSPAQLLTIKGNRDGLLITTGEADWDILRVTLLDHLRDQASFFRGARITLDVGNQVIHAAEMGRLRDDFSEMGVILSTVLSNAPQTTYTARILGLAISQYHGELVSHYNPAHGSPALIIKERLLAGMRIESENDLIILGDTAAGVQLESHGSVIVWGRLLGSVHAGIGNNEDAVVSALVMRPSHLRIAGMLYSRKLHLGIRHPETARIYSGEIILEPWNKRRE